MAKKKVETTEPAGESPVKEQLVKEQPARQAAEQPATVADTKEPDPPAETSSETKHEPPSPKPEPLKPARIEPAPSSTDVRAGQSSDRVDEAHEMIRQAIASRERTVRLSYDTQEFIDEVERTLPADVKRRLCWTQAKG